MQTKTTLTPLQAQAILSHWKRHGDQALVATVERTLAMAHVGGDPRTDAAIILEAIGDVYGVPGPVAGVTTAAPNTSGRGRMVRYGVGRKTPTGAVMNALSMLFVMWRNK